MRPRSALRAVALVSYLMMVPVRVGAQALYASGPGVYLIASPSVHPYLEEDRSNWWMGAGVRFSRNTDAAVRVGRGKDVPYGNPLPITYIGHTVVEGRASHRLRNASAEGGVQVVLEAVATIEDKSGAVSDVENGRVTFREGRRISEYAGRAEVHRVWRWGESEHAAIYPRLGIIVQSRVLRSTTTRYEPEGIIGTNQGYWGFSAGLSAGMGLMIPLGESVRLVVDPYVEATPGYYFLPVVYPGLEVNLNF